MRKRSVHKDLMSHVQICHQSLVTRPLSPVRGATTWAPPSDRTCPRIHADRPDGADASVPLFPLGLGTVRPADESRARGPTERGRGRERDLVAVGAQDRRRRCNGILMHGERASERGRERPTSSRKLKELGYLGGHDLGRSARLLAGPPAWRRRGQITLQERVSVGLTTWRRGQWRCGRRAAGDGGCELRVGRGERRGAVIGGGGERVAMMAFSSGGGGGGGGGGRMEVHIARAPLLACLTCPLCSYLIREATTISECLHTFCKECIKTELSNGDSECCPMCHVGLGTLPLEKLRADHQLNDLKEKLFPTNAMKRKLSTSVGSPGKRKQRSLYSLGVKGTQPGYASRKSRPLPGGVGDGSQRSSMDEEMEDDEDGASDDSPSTVLRLDSRNGGLSRRSSPEEGPDPAKVFPQLEPRRALTPRGEGGSNMKPWTTLKLGSTHLELGMPNGSKAGGAGGAGSRSRRGSRKSSGRRGHIREFPSALDALAQVANADAGTEEYRLGPPSPAHVLELLNPGSMSGALRDTNEGVLSGKGAMWSLKDTAAAATENGQSLQSRLKQTLNGVRDRPSILRQSSIRSPSGGQRSSQALPSGIWFHLESGDLQAGEDSLPALPSPYVRIKDGKLPVYHVKKYLVQKLAHKVKSEMEVEITCRGQPVVSSLPLESIRDIWFSAQISEQPQTQAQGGGNSTAQGTETSGAVPTGSCSSEFPSARDFLMVLTYRRHRKPRINS